MTLKKFILSVAAIAAFSTSSFAMVDFGVDNVKCGEPFIESHIPSNIEVFADDTRSLAQIVDIKSISYNKKTGIAQAWIYGIYSENDETVKNHPEIGYIKFLILFDLKNNLYDQGTEYHLDCNGKNIITLPSETPNFTSIPTDSIAEAEKAFIIKVLKEKGKL